MKDTHLTIDSEDSLFAEVSALIDEGRKSVVKAVNTAMVYTYYGVGQYIVEYEQGGSARAGYGKEVLKRLSARLTEKYGAGWSVETLTKCRKLFRIYGISSTAETKSSSDSNSTTESRNFVHSVDEIHKFILPWSHYQVIMREDNPQARSFYEIEAYNQQLSVHRLQRQRI